MKLSVLLSLILLPVISEQYVANLENWDRATVCNFDRHQMTLSSSESLPFNDSCALLRITGANGSISAKTLSLMPHLKELVIEKSEIYHIEDGALCSLSSLERMSLHNESQFPKLSDSLLSNCGNIKYLLLENLEMEPSALKHLVNLEELRLRKIFILHWTTDYLKALVHLKSLEFLECGIKTLDSGAICLSPNLKKLHLTSSNFPQLSGPMFENCNSVDQLIIEDLAITLNWEHNFKYIRHIPINEGVFVGFVNVTDVYLEQVTIGHITKHHLVGFSKAVNLTIKNANLFAIDSDTFENLNSLHSLVLTFNKLASIDNITNSHLRFLSVSANYISKVNTTAVKENLPKLATLNIACNGLKKDYVDTLSDEFNTNTQVDSNIFVMASATPLPTGGITCI